MRSVVLEKLKPHPEGDMGHELKMCGLRQENGERAPPGATSIVTRCHFL